MKILVTGNQEWFSGVIKIIQELIPDVYVTSNFEQVRGLLREGVVENICILQNVLNFSRSTTNNATGKEAAKAFHEVCPSVPILVWNDRDCPSPLAIGSTMFLDCSMYSTEKFYRVIRNFYQGSFPLPAEVLSRT